MRILKHLLMKVIDYPFFIEFPLIILFTLNVPCKQEEETVKIFTRLGEKWYILVVNI